MGWGRAQSVWEGRGQSGDYRKKERGRDSDERLFPRQATSASLLQRTGTSAHIRSQFTAFHSPAPALKVWRVKMRFSYPFSPYAPHPHPRTSNPTVPLLPFPPHPRLPSLQASLLPHHPPLLPFPTIHARNQNDSMTLHFARLVLRLLWQIIPWQFPRLTFVGNFLLCFCGEHDRYENILNLRPITQISVDIFLSEDRISVYGYSAHSADFNTAFTYPSSTNTLKIKQTYNLISVSRRLGHKVSQCHGHMATFL